LKSRQAELRALTNDGEVFSHDLTPFAAAQEAVTGVAVIPVSVIGPLEIELGEYELEEPFGRLIEAGRSSDRVYVPLAHTEGSLSASLHRGAPAGPTSAGFTTFAPQPP